MAGPDPKSISDDPEGSAVLEQLKQAVLALPPDIQSRVVMLALPMSSRKHNALMVNALQRCSVVVAQNSLREGFGLTCTEAMWKGIPVMGTRACGLRQQLDDMIHGRIVRNPEDPNEVAEKLNSLLQNDKVMTVLGTQARRRVAQRFLIFNQMSSWLSYIGHVLSNA